jgi:hypothetical protein
MEDMEDKVFEIAGILYQTTVWSRLRTPNHPVHLLIGGTDIVRLDGLKQIPHH